jgi:hypothetical protein
VTPDIGPHRLVTFLRLLDRRLNLPNDVAPRLGGAERDVQRLGRGFDPLFLFLLTLTTVRPAEQRVRDEGAGVDNQERPPRKDRPDGPEAGT